MGVFADEAEVHKYIGGVFEKGLADPDIGPKLSASGVVLQINYTDPEAIVTVDLPNATVLAGATDITPDVELFMSADTGNRFWQGKVNLSLAMAKGEVRAKGPVQKVIKLVPTAKLLFPTYTAMLAADGRSDLEL
ncbi:sterol carrier protein [Mycobacterium sp. ENV421]|uniref:SCP2 sterol-binding domain-containing protein n=1 Tax=Mycobacterium sp. ENV421 TaxID=1213407 RepID=UPI000C99A573|nr:SCP2 sterol-binding domain-containing protein [Mycobacterium sp. ENV421]PND54290.1 sterol carrier protein [Mycobacterium sp. ENV421]